eukprot:GFUD01064768.1.p1 GENE.GFUD01064768.1~~GFUD01064768.1.p1  ORF type:complete len:106 (-),score=24.10 GFUD01064768.1:312-629(-)
MKEETGLDPLPAGQEEGDWKTGSLDGRNATTLQGAFFSGRKITDLCCGARELVTQQRPGLGHNITTQDVRSIILRRKVALSLPSCPPAWSKEVNIKVMLEGLLCN